MKERPILFSAPMIRAILEGRKTQTRRLVKPQPKEPWLNHHQEAGCCRSDWTLRMSNGDGIWYWSSAFVEDAIIGRCPYGVPGDHIWVKEAFIIIPNNGVYYRATNPLVGVGKWKPSIFMPRRLSRITLELTAVRVERLQEITEEDAKAEGCSGGHDSIPGYSFSATPKEEYQYVWSNINGTKDGLSTWAQNPWVWLLSFKRITP